MGWRWWGRNLQVPSRGYGFIQYFDSWPPKPLQGKEYVVPAEGATISPTPEGEGWEWLLGIEPTRPGLLSRSGVRVNYSIDGKAYSRLFASELYVCSTRSGQRSSGKCRLPDDWSDDSITSQE
jgi:hypothetical protein